MRQKEGNVTVYVPKKCYQGYTVFVFAAGPKVTRLVDMQGRVVKDWHSYSERSRYLANDNILAVGREPSSIRELDWQDRVVWEYGAPGKVHHDVQRLPNGNTLLLYVEPVPEEQRRKSKDPARAALELESDVILEMYPSKATVFEWHQYEHFDIDWCKDKFRQKADWIHTNTVQALPENRWFARGDARFRPGNYLISLRNLDTILVIDRSTRETVWRHGGVYRGGFSGQHEPHMIEPGLPGEGNLLIFDNGVEENHHGQSIVQEFDPVTLDVVWTYEPDGFYSPYRSTAQRLPNGNTFICSSDEKRMIEVTPDGETVWEYRVPADWRAPRAQRVPYGFTPKLAGLA